MVMSTRANGRMIKLTDMESTCIQMGLSMKVTGKKISNTAKEKRHGLMVPVILETMLKERKMGLENSDGLTVQHTKDSF